VATLDIVLAGIVICFEQKGKKLEMIRVALKDEITLIPLSLSPLFCILFDVNEKTNKIIKQTQLNESFVCYLTSSTNKQLHASMKEQKSILFIFIDLHDYQFE
jgi:hypothetical protein